MSQPIKFQDLYQRQDNYGRCTPVRGRNLAVTSHRGKPGTIQILKSPEENKPDIICLLSQWTRRELEKFHPRKILHQTENPGFLKVYFS